jgi:hypothetical protein
MIADNERDINSLTAQDEDTRKELREAVKRRAQATGVKKGIPLKKLVDLRKKGLSFQDIANAVGCARPTVYQRLRPYLSVIDSKETAKIDSAELYRLKSLEALSYLSTAKLKESNAYHLSLITGILHDHALKAAGAYNADVNLLQIHIDIGKIREEKARIYAELRTLEGAHDGQGGVGVPGGENSDPAPMLSYLPQGTTPQRGEQGVEPSTDLSMEDDNAVQGEG